MIHASYGTSGKDQVFKQVSFDAVISVKGKLKVVEED